jgi:hypothetical protein
MYFFLSTLNPSGFSSQEVLSNQNQYLMSHKSWQMHMKIGTNYYYVDNSLKAISDITCREFLKICWDLEDFGVVIPYVVLAKKRYSSDPNIGSIELFKSIFCDFDFSRQSYLIIILGKRFCDKNLSDLINNWILDSSSSGLYFVGCHGEIIDNVVGLRLSNINKFRNFIESINPSTYAQFIKCIADEFSFEKKIIE